MSFIDAHTGYFSSIANVEFETNINEPAKGNAMCAVFYPEENYEE